jgi:ATP-dependent helicase YprA (DUF1998 family)
MDVFDLRDHVVGDYASYVKSFVRIRDPQIRNFVDSELESGVLWPSPLVQLNPAYAPGGSINDLVSEGLLHPECGRIFRRGKDKNPAGEPLRLYAHQRRAIEVARTGRSYVLTTGTGSGKSLAYMVPIIDHVLRKPSGARQGRVSAIVVYPMNALCNSQMEELRKFLVAGYGDGKQPVTFARYTGQESTEERERLANSAPDILLTNFMMLELIMTRPTEIDRKVIRAAQGLDFLVLDELHTYRGRQGADVAMLVRRVRERTRATSLRCVGTSATIAGAGTRTERLQTVARVASTIFGTIVEPESVIDESLVEVTRGDPSLDALRRRLGEGPSYPEDAEGFVSDPVATWIERVLGLRKEDDGTVVRAEPRDLPAAATLLAEQAGSSSETTANHLREALLAGFRAKSLDTGLPLFAFRLHQFVSRGDTVYASVGDSSQRYLTMQAQQFVPEPPGDRSRILLPLAFCRECGQEYYVVDWDQREGQLSDRSLGGRRALRDGQLRGRDVSSRAEADDGDIVSGYVALAAGLDWTGDPDEDFPEDWVETGPDGFPRVARAFRDLVPTSVRVAADGKCSPGTALPGVNAWFLSSPFRVCVRCRVSYSGRQRSDIGKLTELATEGRSTATTVISLSVVQSLRAAADVSETARKLLSFTDNRQDASLQAGHFNDFVQTTWLRGALLKAVSDAGPGGLDYEELPIRVVDSLGLDYADYGRNPDDEYSRDDAKKALRAVIAYRVFNDMRFGWRLTSPNLEQAGLLAIEYEHLRDLCADVAKWDGTPQYVWTATPEDRERACREVLNWMRRALAVNAGALETDDQDRMKRLSEQHLRSSNEPAPRGGLSWGIEGDERLHLFRVARLGSAIDPRGDREAALTAQSGIGHFLRSPGTWAGLPDQKKLPAKDFPALARSLIDVLARNGFLEPYGGKEFREAKDGTGRPIIYRLRMARLRWRLGDGKPAIDLTRTPRVSRERAAANVFFKDLYQHVALNLATLEAREHTAQVATDDRETREERFRQGTLPVLYCSPTMELGVDISDLSSVNMRNVPPTPANYAQRSGRAGRGGQPALVTTYCSSMNQHDQYFFRRPGLMVSGAVQPPRLDLANEDLVKAHVHAEWLAATEQSLGRSMQDVIDLTQGDALPLLPGVADSLASEHARNRAAAVCAPMLDQLAATLADAPWHDGTWLARALIGAPSAFDRAADRWRFMYRSAMEQRQEQERIARDMAVAKPDRDRAALRRDEAQRQLDLLAGQEVEASSDFNPYRYFASEGFLPGYNFPRLPIAAYLPGERLPGSRRREMEAISRPRFIAVSEFGPRSLIYHEGARYRVDGVILPTVEGDGLRTTSCKLCGLCGFAHFGDGVNDEVCHGCGESMEGASRTYSELLRLAGVKTRRTARITSDEEERLRLGYEVRTAYAFASGPEGERRVRTSYVAKGAGVASGELAPTATLWRFNLGWVRRRNKEIHGFNLNMDTGRWSRSDQEPDADSEENEAAQAAGGIQRVVPFVEDRRNTLLLRFDSAVAPKVLMSLQYALKRGIETVYQVEPSELAVEPLPTPDEPRLLMFYESAEGGAGVLERLAIDQGAMAAVARAALDVCHFDPTTGEDQRRAPHAREDCEAACYDCLRSYSNTRYHEILDRQLVKDVLLQLAGCETSVGGGSRSRAEQFAELRRTVDPGSSAEPEFLDFLEANGFRPPDEAQKHIAEPPANPDFYYRDAAACVFIDGRHHLYEHRKARDADTDRRLREAGYEVIRFTPETPWEETARAHAWVFGEEAK